MNISKETLAILRNFSTINPGIVVKAGSLIKTQNPESKDARGAATGVVTAAANVEEVFPRDFAIANLSKFLNVVDLFEDPQIEFDETDVIIRDSSGKKSTVRYANSSLISHPPYDKSIQLPTVDVEFDISDHHFATVVKAASNLESPHVAFIGDGETVVMSTFNGDRLQADKFSVQLGETDKTFRAVVKIEYLKMIRQDYHISYCKKGFIEFKGTPSYWMGVIGNKSSFEE